MRWLGRRRFARCRRHPAGVIGSSFATDKASARTCPILRDLCRLRWPLCTSIWSTEPTSCSGSTSARSPATPMRAERRRGRSGGLTLQLVSEGATHIGVASDHVIESFRNDLWAGYKTSAGMEPELLEQIPVMEEALISAGFTTWPMVEYEADDALGAAAAVAAADPRVDAGADRHAGQGPRPMRARHAGGAVRPAQGRDRRRGRRHGEVRRRPGVDRRLPGAGRRHRRRLPRAGRLGRQERRRGAGQVRLDRRRFRASSGDWGLPACAAPRSWRSRCATTCELALLFRRIATIELDVPVGHGRRLALDRARRRGSRPSPSGSGRRTWSTEPDALAARRPRGHPPSEVTARLPAAHKRYR